MYLFIPDISSNILQGLDAAHFFSLRVKRNEILKVTDLKGTLAEIKILGYDKNSQSVDFEIHKQEVFENKARNILYQTVIDKYYLEKLFEVLPFMKLKEIVLFYSQHSIKLKPNLERLTNILTRSLEQSESLFIPKITIIETKNYLQSLEEIKPIVLDCYLDTKSSSNSSQRKVALGSGEGFDLELKPNENIKTQGNKQAPNSKLLTNNSALVGPEGGWSQEEKDFFINNNFQFYNLGDIIYPAWLAGFGYFERVSRGS